MTGAARDRFRLASAPAPGWRVHEVAASLRIEVTRAMPPLPATLDREVERLWGVALARTGGGLFNGRVFNADAITPERINGHWTEYRRVVAQMERPDLFGDLAVRPTAVGGSIVGPDGVVFGRRPARAVYQAGLWQLPPAGSLDMGSAEPDGSVAFRRQVLAELGEELGMTPEMVRLVGPLCVVEHAGSHVCDLGIAIETALDASAIAAAHQGAPDAEYDMLRIVPTGQLAGFVAEAGAEITPQAVAFLICMGLLSGG